MAVLAAFGMPIVCTFFIVVIKHSNETLKIAAYDFTIAHWGLMGIILQIAAAIYFKYEPQEFDWTLWKDGFIASLLNLIGCTFAISAFQTGSPIGPSAALMCT